MLEGVRWVMGYYGTWLEEVKWVMGYYGTLLEGVRWVRWVMWERGDNVIPGKIR